MNLLTTFSTPATQPSPDRQVVSGRFLAHNRLNARHRAELAAALISGRAELGKLTRAQITRLCRANAVYVREAIEPGRAHRLRMRRLQRAWETIDPECRAELCRAIGVERVWIALSEAVG